MGPLSESLMIFTHRQLELLLRGDSAGDGWPWLNDEGDSKEVENYV